MVVGVFVVGGELGHSSWGTVGHHRRSFAKGFFFGDLFFLGGGNSKCFKSFLGSPPNWGRFPFGLICFRWVGSTTNQGTITYPLAVGSFEDDEFPAFPRWDMLVPWRVK